jgi:hypothetical protein
VEGRPGMARSDRACCSGMRRMFGTSRLRLQGRQAEILRLDLLADECRGATAATHRLACLEAMMMSLKPPRAAVSEPPSPCWSRRLRSLRWSGSPAA